MQTATDLVLHPALILMLSFTLATAALRVYAQFKPAAKE